MLVTRQRVPLVRTAQNILCAQLSRQFCFQYNPGPCTIILLCCWSMFWIFLLCLFWKFHCIIVRYKMLGFGRCCYTNIRWMLFQLSLNIMQKHFTCRPVTGVKDIFHTINMTLIWFAHLICMWMHDLCPLELENS